MYVVVMAFLQVTATATATSSMLWAFAVEAANLMRMAMAFVTVRFWGAQTLPHAITTNSQP